MIKWIIICLIGLIILGNMGIDIRKSINSTEAQSNLGYAKEVAVHVWVNYLSEPAKFLWSEVFVKYGWNPLKNYLDSKLKGSSSNTENKTSSVQSGRFVVYG